MPKTWQFSAFYDMRTFHLPRQNPYFCLKWLKIKAFGEWEWYLSPIVPLFCASVSRQPKSKAFGLEFVNRTVLDKNEYDLWWKKFLRGADEPILKNSVSIFFTDKLCS